MLYTSSNNSSLSGTKKVQNGNKTFTTIPTILHYIQNDTIKFGPTITIMEGTKKGEFSRQYINDLRKVGLDKGMDREKELINDTSTPSTYVYSLHTSTRSLQLHLQLPQHFP